MVLDGADVAFVVVNVKFAGVFGVESGDTGFDLKGVDAGVAGEVGSQKENVSAVAHQLAVG